MNNTVAYLYSTDGEATDKIQRKRWTDQRLAVGPTAPRDTMPMEMLQLQTQTRNDCTVEASSLTTSALRIDKAFLFWFQFSLAFVVDPTSEHVFSLNRGFRLVLLLSRNCTMAFRRSALSLCISILEKPYDRAARTNRASRQ
ncbi:hypothetical protein Y032_0034g2926 [Ancylostoma ceylanicum]|uniref:Uncharacterized protein n=1 Tax=Ancylostoma ceylanicum TaxID=53326 RepID=A0A016UN15_9BILA|nr:hypothetical protein Y032_0034g2926 [Ancylostoma ceylanicum]